MEDEQDDVEREKRERVRELDEIFAKRIIAGDRELIDGILGGLQRQLICFAAATSTDVPAEVIVALEGFNEARAASDRAMLQLLGMQGAIGKSPDGMLGRLVDPETGMELALKLEKKVDLGARKPEEKL